MTNGRFRRPLSLVCITWQAAVSLQTTFDFSSSAVQRVLTRGAARPTHTHCPDAAVYHSYRGRPEGRLYEATRSQSFRDPPGAAPVTASLRLDWWPRSKGSMVAPGSIWLTGRICRISSGGSHCASAVNPRPGDHVYPHDRIRKWSTSGTATVIRPPKPGGARKP